MSTAREQATEAEEFDDGCPCDSDMYATGDCPVHDTETWQP
jgi:hypothetical protein